MHIAQPTIPAAHHRIGGAAIYHLLIRPAIWHNFARVWVQIHGRLPRTRDAPLIIYANHPSWWDGYMMALLQQTLLPSPLKLFLMMDETQLRRFPFFSWCGAFSINLDERKQTLRSLHYITQILRNATPSALVIFPQGAIVPNDQRPLRIMPGMAHMVQQLGGAWLYPIAMRYEFRGEQHAEAFLRLGPLWWAAPDTKPTLTHTIAQHLVTSVDALRDACISEQLDDFRILMHGKPGIDRLTHRATNYSTVIHRDD